MANKKENPAVITDEMKEALEAELRAKIEAELRADAAEVKLEVSGETKEQIKRANEKVPYMLPIIDGEPEEVNVTLNGQTIQILRGEQVEIPRKFAEILDNQTKQMKYLRKYQEEKKEQVTVVE